MDANDTLRRNSERCEVVSQLYWVSELKARKVKAEAKGLSHYT